MKRLDRRVKFVNFFGALGYLSLILQWLWATVVIAYPFLMDAAYSQVDRAQPKTPPFTTDLPPSITLIIVGITTALVVITSLVVMVRMPKTISTKTANLTQAVAHTITPLIAQAPKSKKKRRVFSVRVVLGVKVAAWLIPLLAIYFSPQNAPLPYDVVSVTALFCAAITAAYFCLQYGLARLLHVPGIKLR